MSPLLVDHPIDRWGPAMHESKETQMEILRDRINRHDYEVDPHAVAGAILERLLAGAAKPLR